MFIILFHRQGDLDIGLPEFCIRLVDLLFNRSYWHYEIQGLIDLKWTQSAAQSAAQQQDTQWLKDTLSQLSDNEAMSVALDWT